MSRPQADSARLNAVHQTIQGLSEDEISALQAFGIQQAGRNGLGRDGRVYVTFGTIAILLGLLIPTYLLVKVVEIIAGTALLVSGIKVYLRPSIKDMLWIVALLGFSGVWNALAGIVSLVAFNQLALLIFFIVLAGVEGRWAYSLWQAYHVAQQSDKNFNERYSHLVTLYHQLSEILGASEPRPDNPIVHLRAGKQSLRMMLSGHYGVILYQTGMIQVLPAHALAMRLINQQTPIALTFEAELMLNQRVLRGEVSQISYHTFQAWQDSLS